MRRERERVQAKLEIRWRGRRRSPKEPVGAVPLAGVIQVMAQGEAALVQRLGCSVRGPNSLPRGLHPLSSRSHHPNQQASFPNTLCALTLPCTPALSQGSSHLLFKT